MNKHYSYIAAGDSLAHSGPIPQPLQARIAALHAQGYSIHQISARLLISYGTAWKYVQRYKGTLPMAGAHS
jgi:DNA-binding NarL/FixJ family response regulator